MEEIRAVVPVSFGGEMALMLQAIAGFFKRSRDDLAEERRAYDRKITEIRRLESRNRLAYANSRLNFLQEHGKPFYSPPQLSRQEQASDHQTSRPTEVTPCYLTDEKTGYPFVPAALVGGKGGYRYEQDPLFGWGMDAFGDFGGMSGLGALGTNVPVSSFPREMFPERPSTLRTQIAQDAIRFMSRAWYETMPQYSGCIGHFVNYIVGNGLDIDVVSPIDEGLAREVMDYLEEFTTFGWNNIQDRVEASALNLFRDGEDALRLFPGEEYPQIRSTDTSTIRGPHNEISGPWAYGVLTSWPRDYEDVRAYHAWYSDNTHEDVSPSLLKLCKLDTTGPNVKRGVPLAFKIRKQLPQLARLVDCMAIGESARQAIPYVQQYAMADKSTVGASLRSSEQQPVPPDPYGRGGFGDGYGDGYGDDIEPGQVRHINKGQEFVDPPNAQGFAASGTAVYRTLCEACACATNTPIWFWTGSADSENYSSSLVSESPVVKRIQRYQRKLTDHYKSVFASAVMIGVAQGRFPADVLKIVKLHVELPTPVGRNRKDEVETDLRLMDKGLLSPQHVCARNDLQWDEERELIASAEESGWTNQMGVVPGESAANQAGPAGEEEPAETGNEPRREQGGTFNEGDHPRADDGKFGEGGGGGGRADEKETATEKETTGQKRAKVGGEIAPNGEWYKGGAFIATTEMPKKLREKRDRAASGQVQVEADGKREVPTPGQNSIVDALAPMVDWKAGEINETATAYYGWSKEKTAQAKELLSKYKAGERWVNVNDYMDFSKYQDLARMAKAGVPIDADGLERMAKMKGMDVPKLLTELGVKKDSTAEKPKDDKRDASGGDKTNASPLEKRGIWEGAKFEAKGIPGVMDGAGGKVTKIIDSNTVEVSVAARAGHVTKTVSIKQISSLEAARGDTAVNKWTRESEEE